MEATIMASLAHLDVLLGESLEQLMDAAREIGGLEELDQKASIKRIGAAVMEIWAVREEIYRLHPTLKRDFVRECEQDEERFESLNELFQRAAKFEDTMEMDSARRLYQELLKRSRFGYFRLLAEAGLYRVMAEIGGG